MKAMERSLKRDIHLLNDAQETLITVMEMKGILPKVEGQWCPLRLDKKMKTLSILFYCIYLYINYNFTIKVTYTDITEQLIGIITITFLGGILDAIAYNIAYSITGTITSSRDEYFSKSAMHWFIRIMLWSIITILGKTGLFTIILTPLIQWLSTNYKSQLDELGRLLKNPFLPQ